MVTGNSKGFTLLEVMIALAIIAVSLVVILHSQTLGMSLANRSRDLSVASFLAQKRMEEIEMQGFPELGEKEGIVDENYPGFSYRQVVSPGEFSGKSLEGLRKITVTISWLDGSEKQSREIISYIAKRGRQD